MKNLTQTIGMFLLIISGVSAQQEKGITGASNWLNNWTEFKPNKTDYYEPNQILAGAITTDTKLLKQNTYLLQGNVLVKNNATLTIEPGTIIVCDAESKATLVITKGAKIIAEGIQTDPIIFTSNKSFKKAGDWGGIIILGDAPINKFGGVGTINYNFDPLASLYGGANIESNSGIMRYVRIEYAGGRTRDGKKYDSLLLAGVGNKTVLENVMVSYSGSDSFEINGGDVNLNKLVSYKSNNNDFKFNYGTQCRINNSLVVRSSFVSGARGARCLDIASYDKKDEVDFTKKQTAVVATNLTLLNNSENIDADIKSGLIKEAVYIAENTSLECRKSVISGFNPAVLLDSKIVINDQNLKKIKFEQMYFNFCNGNIFTEYNSNNEDLENWYGNGIFANVYAKSDNKETFIDIQNDKRPDYRLKIGKIIASNMD